MVAADEFIHENLRSTLTLPTRPLGNLSPPKKKENISCQQVRSECHPISCCFIVPNSRGNDEALINDYVGQGGKEHQKPQEEWRGRP